MSFKVKRTRNRQRRAKRERTYLLSIGEGNCDCPICQSMGIDLDASNGVDVRPIEDPEQFERMLALLEEVRTMPSN